MELDVWLLSSVARLLGGVGRMRWLALGDAADEFSRFMRAQVRNVRHTQLLA